MILTAEHLNKIVYRDGDVNDPFIVRLARSNGHLFLFPLQEPAPGRVLEGLTIQEGEDGPFSLAPA